MKKRWFLVVLLLLSSLGVAMSATRPEWVWKNETYLNRKRTNTSYEFKVFKTEDNSKTRLHEGRFYPLLKYIGETCGADPATMVLDSLYSDPGAPCTYRISFPENGGQASVLAQLVDVYEDVDYNVGNDPFFELYQLYAISGKDAPVTFDDFKSGERSKGTAALLNVVAPGAGQLYKGQTFKGAVLLGSEIALGAAAITFHCNSRYFRSHKDLGVHDADSFHSKEIGQRRLRNFTLGAMAGIWAFGIYDALAKESTPCVVVSASDGRTLSVAPASGGVAFVYRF